MRAILPSTFPLIVALVTGAASSSPVFAVDYTWTGTTNNTWSTAANWGGTAPASAASTAVFFGTATNRSPNVTASTTIGSITFNSGGDAFTISRSGGTFTLSGGGVTNNSSNLQLITAAIALSSATTWNTASADLTASGVLSGSGASVTKTGTGTLTLSGANTYTGTTTISAGTLQVGSGSTAGALGTGAVTDDGILSFNRSNAFTVANAISGAGSVKQTGTGVTTLTGANTYSGGTTISAGTLQFSSGGLGSGAIAVNGGTLRWASGNSSDISSVLTLGSSGGTLDTVGDVALANAVTVGGSLTKAGAGILTLNGSVASATSITVNGGTLRSGAANVLPSGVSYTVNGTTANATLDLNGSDLSIGALTLGGTGAGGSVVNTVSTGVGTLTLGGNLAYSATNDPGAASITGKLNLGSVGTRIIDVANSANAAIDLTIGATIGGSGVGINKSGAGTLVLTGTNTYTGGTTISGGVLQFNSPANFGTGTSPIVVSGFGTTLQWAPGNTDGLARGVSIANNYGVLDTNGNNVTLATAVGGSGRLSKAGNGILGLSSAPSVTSVVITAGTLRLDADNAFAPNVGMAVVGTANDSGLPTILDLNGHNLTVASLDLGAYYSGRNAVNMVTTGANTLTLNGNLTYAIQGDPYDYYDPGTAVISGKLDLGSSTHTINVQDSYNTGFELNITADVSGGTGITKTGDGFLALGGTNTYSGNTIISAGTLRAGSLPATTNLQMNGGVFELASDLPMVSGTGAGQIQWTGGGGGFSAFGGNRTVDIKDTGGTSVAFTWGGGGFVADGSNLVLSSLAADSTVTFANNINLNGNTRTVVVNNGTSNVDAVLSGIVSNGALNVTGGGTLKLSGTNTFSGGTNISGYTNPLDSTTVPTTVEFASGGLGTGGVSLADGSEVRWATGNTDGLAGTIYIGSGGGTLNTNGNNVVLNSALSGATVYMTKKGEGILTLNTPSSYVGYVTVSAGTLRLGAAGALGTSQYGLAIINANTAGANATFDTNGFDYYLYSLNFGGTAAQANAINTVSTGTGAIYLTTGGGINYAKATLNANDPGAAFFTGNLNLYSFAATITVADSTNTTEELTISANISSTGTLGFTKSGAGTLILSGNNTYTGNTTLSGGTLRLASSTALSTGSLTISSGSLEFGGNGITVNNAIALGSSVRTFSTLDGSAVIDATLGGVISGTGGISKTGAGTLKLSGNNTFTGNISNTAGTLQFGTQKSLYNNTVASWTAAKIITSSGATTAFNVGGTGEFTAANIDTLKGLSTSATTGFRSGSFLGLDTTNASGAKFTYGSAIANTNGGANVLGLTKLGTGTLVLTGTSTYSGATTVKGGTLQIDGSIVNSATTVNSGGKLQGRGTLGAVTMNTGSTLMAGDSATLRNLTIGSLLFNAGATLQFKLDSSLVQSDLVTLSGQLTLNNTALVLTDLATLPTALADGTTLTLISYNDGMGNGLGTGTDIFLYNGQSLTEGSTFTAGLNTFQINYAVGDPTVTLTTVPEPGTWLMLALGLGLVGYVQSRRRQSAAK